MSLSTRQLIRSCKLKGWTLHPKALEGIQGFLSQSTNALDDFAFLLEMISEKMGTGKTVTPQIWEHVSTEIEGEAVASSDHRHTSGDDLVVVNAFQSPRLSYDPMRKHFSVEQKPWSLLGSVKDKINMLSQRYALAQQRILRHKLFRPTELHSSRTSMQLKLTPVESLLGQRTANTHLLLGILIQIEEGVFYLEDPTGQVPVSFTQAVAVDDFFVVERCILLVEGIFEDDVLHVQRIGHPLVEPRLQSLQAIQQQLSHPAFSLSHTTDISPKGSSFVVLSDLRMDRPKVVSRLEGILASYDTKCSSSQMLCFVFMGNFAASHKGSADAITELVSMIAKFPNLAAHAHFCIVPGPLDTAALTWPLPPLTKPHHRHQIASLHMGSNPCRIRWQGREMVVFCCDLLNLLQRRQVFITHKVLETQRESSQPHRRMIKTLLDQGHLLPVADVPIFWNYDHVLRLYPLPDSLILGGLDECNYAHFEECYEGCEILYPGSFAQHSEYAVYHPGHPDHDSDDEDRLSDGSTRRVEFHHPDGRHSI